MAGHQVFTAEGAVYTLLPVERAWVLDRNLAMFGPDVEFTTELDFAGAALGAEWTLASGVGLVRRTLPLSTEGAGKRKMEANDGESANGWCCNVSLRA